MDKEEQCERREAELQFDSASDDEPSPARKQPSSPQKLQVAKATEAPEDVQREQSEATRAESPESLNVESVDDSVHATIEDPAVHLGLIWSGEVVRASGILTSSVSPLPKAGRQGSDCHGSSRGGANDRAV